MIVKEKNCKVCNNKFMPRNSMVKVCSINCAMSIASNIRITTQRKTLSKEKKQSNANDRSWQLKETEKACNAYIRYRDRELGCISCGRTDSKYPFQAGHYLAVGSHPELRYEELNIHKQCLQCNTHKSGNQAAYRPRLIDKIRVDRVEWLESHHPPKQYTIDELIELRGEFKLKLKELKHGE